MLSKSVETGAAVATWTYRAFIFIYTRQYCLNTKTDKPFENSVKPAGTRKHGQPVEIRSYFNFTASPFASDDTTKSQNTKDIAYFLKN